MTHNCPSLNNWINAFPSQFTLETFKGLQLKCLGSIMNYRHMNEQCIQVKGGRSL